MVEIRKGVYIKTFFWTFMEEKDVLGVIFKDEKGWHFRFRHRAYNPESTDPFDGLDEKKQYEIVFKEEDLEGVCKIAEEMFLEGSKLAGAEQTMKYDVNTWGDDPHIMDVIKELPFMHCRKATDD